MFNRWKSFFMKPAVLFAVLFAQVVLYWTIAVYQLGESVPVAYQRF